MIRGHRHSNEISIDQLAKILKLTKAELQKIESGKVRLPLKEVVSIAKKIDGPKNVFAKVWCEEELKAQGLSFDDLTRIF